MVLLCIAASIILLAFLIAGIAAVRSNAPANRGEAGENAVARILGGTAEGRQYVINDLLFADGDGKSCQIDHVYINKYGIWVIETKNYSGRIYGDENRREWTQVLANGRVVNKFYNPVKQNATHIYHLSKFLKAGEVFQNVVVFLKNADISALRINNVYSVKGLGAIKNTVTGVVLTDEQMRDYYRRLLKLKEENKISKREHINNIREMQYKINSGLCPRCGAKLVLRNGPNGLFYGCSNYPACTFTKNSD